jgi:SAM-dependent methyltransferase
MNPEFDSYAGSYSELLRDPMRDRFGDAIWFHRRKWDLVRSFLAAGRLDPARMEWLDVGCGEGTFIELAGRNFKRAAGCDPSPRMISGSSLYEVRVQNSPADLPYPDESFDFVSAVCVYHHVELEDRPKLTRSIRRVLRPGGVACIIEHNPINPVTRMIVRRCPVDRNARLLGASQTRELMRTAGLKVMDQRYFLYLPKPLFRYFGQAEQFLKAVPLGGQYALFGCRERELVSAALDADPVEAAS